MIFPVSTIETILYYTNNIFLYINFGFDDNKHIRTIIKSNGGPGRILSIAFNNKEERCIKWIYHNIHDIPGNVAIFKAITSQFLDMTILACNLWYNFGYKDILLGCCYALINLNLDIFFYLVQLDPNILRNSRLQKIINYSIEDSEILYDWWTKKMGKKCEKRRIISILSSHNRINEAIEIIESNKHPIDFYILPNNQKLLKYICDNNKNINKDDILEICIESGNVDIVEKCVTTYNIEVTYDIIYQAVHVSNSIDMIKMLYKYVNINRISQENTTLIKNLLIGKCNEDCILYIWNIFVASQNFNHIDKLFVADFLSNANQKIFQEITKNIIMKDKIIKSMDNNRLYYYAIKNIDIYASKWLYNNGIRCDIMLPITLSSIGSIYEPENFNYLFENNILKNCEGLLLDIIKKQKEGLFRWYLEKFGTNKITTTHVNYINTSKNINIIKISYNNGININFENIFHQMWESKNIYTFDEFIFILNKCGRLQKIKMPKFVNKNSENKTYVKNYMVKTDVKLYIKNYI